ncbi:MAG: GTP-binding protein [Cyanobacteria bacterium J06635_1]
MPESNLPSDGSASDPQPGRSDFNELLAGHSLEDEPLDREPLDQTLAEFDGMAAELHYQQAVSVVEQLVDTLDLTARERSGLEAEIKSLGRLQLKLSQGVIHIAAFGMVGRGKSSILNALVGQPIFTTGPLHGVTQQIESVPWSVEVMDNGSAPDFGSAPAAGVYRVVCGDQQARVELVDTPGIDEVGGEVRQMIAQRVARQSDLILFVIAGDLTQVEYDALVQLRQAKKPILLVFNKTDQYTPADQSLILEKLEQQVALLQIAPSEIVLAAAAPLVVTVDPQRQIRRQRGSAQVDALKLKMLDVLHREGKSLVALNTLLYADTLHEQLIARKLEIRTQSADDVIWKLVLAKATAVAINPILVADLMGGAAIDLSLIVTLSRLYGLELTQHGALNLLKTMALAMGGLSASQLLITFGLSSLKSLLGASVTVTGGLSVAPYLSVAVTQAAVAGVSTYAIGQVTKAYLANGASWGESGPKAAIAAILANLDETSIMARIKADLRSRNLVSFSRDT